MISHTTSMRGPKSYDEGKRSFAQLQAQVPTTFASHGWVGSEYQGKSMRWTPRTRHVRWPPVPSPSVGKRQSKLHPRKPFTHTSPKERSLHEFWILAHRSAVHRGHVQEYISHTPHKRSPVSTKANSLGQRKCNWPLSLRPVGLAVGKGQF